MSLWRQLTRGLRNLTNPGQADRDVAEEVEQYLDEATAAFRASGLSPEEARRAARVELGSVTAVRQDVRGYGWENLVDTTVADFRYAVRRLRRTPVFTLVGALTLALGIGASTAIFSAVNPVLFESLPYPDAGRLVMIWDGQNGTRTNSTFGTYRELSARSHSFESISVMRPVQVTLTGVPEPERLQGQYVSANYFRTLGVQPILGRDFQESDDRPKAPLVVLMSHSLWQRHFGGDRAIVGALVTFNEVPVTVIGVLPRAFENVLSPGADVWGTLQDDPSLPLNGREWGHNLRMIGRLRPDVSLDQAALELDAIAGQPLEDFPRPDHASLSNGFIAGRLQDELTMDVRPVLLAVLGAVILLLAIACVNVTNLLLARGNERRTELAVRAALGASQSRLVRQLLAEYLVLATLGGVGGAMLAYGTVDTVTALSPTDLPRISAIAIDGSVLAFTLGITTLVGLVIGLVPALHGSRAEIQGGVQQRSARIASGHRPVRRVFVVAQVALAVVLLIGAGLILRSLQRLLAIPSGFEPAGLLTMEVQTAGTRFFDANTSHRFFDQTLEAIRRVPGVTAAAFTSQLPLSGGEDIWGVHFESIPRSASEEDHDGYRYAVSPGYFEAMGIPLRKGRVLNAYDDARAPGVAVINEAFARRRLPGLDPIGQRVRIGPNSGPWLTVVGVVADVKQTALSVVRSDAIYLTAAQWTRFADPARWIVVRTQGDPAALTPDIRRAIQSVDKSQSIANVATMEQRVRDTEAGRRFALILFESFGIVALVLAAIGIYGLLSGTVTERTREIGVRAALGASRWNVVALVLRQGMTMTGLGIALGVVGGGLASGALVTLLFGVSRLDSTTYLGVIALLACVSAVACILPAWRATRIHPSIALTSE
jgi:putative ABC transport system permease protein